MFNSCESVDDANSGHPKFSEAKSDFIGNLLSFRMGSNFLSFSLERFYLFIFRERGWEGEREGEKHQCVVVSQVPPTGDLAHNPGMCPDWELNWQPLGSQAGTQSTEPHQPGLIYLFFLCTQHFVNHIINSQ